MKRCSRASPCSVPQPPSFVGNWGPLPPPLLPPPPPHEFESFSIEAVRVAVAGTVQVAGVTVPLDAILTIAPLPSFFASRRSPKSIRCWPDQWYLMTQPP